MRIFITGGTGFIGQALVGRLLHRGDEITVLSRDAAKASTLFGPRVRVWASLDKWGSEIIFDAVINLAGEPIVDKPWTTRRRKALFDSRIGITKQLQAAMNRAEIKPKIFLSGSAIGIYGDTGPVVCTENSPNAGDFAAMLCRDWESAAGFAESLGIRTVFLRTGLVLHEDGGMLKKMQLPFKLGFGSQLGDGQQMMSWIHRHDYLNALLFLLDNDNCNGAFNMTAPKPVSNQEFTRAYAHSLNRPALLSTPAFILKPMLGERSILLLGGQNVVPEKLLKAGFHFRYAELNDALKNAGVN